MLQNVDEICRHILKYLMHKSCVEIPNYSAYPKYDTYANRTNTQKMSLLQSRGNLDYFMRMQFNHLMVNSQWAQQELLFILMLKTQLLFESLIL